MVINKLATKNSHSVLKILKHIIVGRKHKILYYVNILKLFVPANWRVVSNLF